MTAAAEAPLVYAFAALLAIGSVVILFVPLLRHVSLFSASRAVFALVIASMLGLAVAAVLVVTYSISDPAYFLPIAGVTVALRIVSPALLYRRVRERFEARRSWPLIRILFGAGCLVLVGVLVYNLALVLSGAEPPIVATLSEQFAMAVGASALIVRTALRLRPMDTLELWPVWLSATSFAIAFVLVAPYAFPAFATTYIVSGVAGWCLGAIITRYVD